MDSTRTSRERRRPAALPVVVVIGAILAAGCGSVGYSKGTGDRTKGKELFTQRCGSCHTLADAGTKGQIGPNLDSAFYEARQNGLGQSTIVQVVRGQIAYAVSKTSTGAPGMPRNLVDGQDAEDVASYVAGVAGTGNPAPAAPVAPAAAPKAPTGTGATKGDVAAGKKVFASAGCGGCHTLADAGSNGAVGPNLDQAKPDAARVKQRVTNGKGVMPSFKGQLTDAQIADVAAYVSAVAGK